MNKAIIEEFLPRYGYGSEVLYVGDAPDKYLVRDDARLKELDLLELSQGELPNIVAYSTERRWLYLIEAVHSCGPISNQRRIQLEHFTKNSKAGVVFVTAFLDLKSFRKSAAEIGWETEVWIASEPDHRIHWNGDRFFGPRT